MSDKTRRPAQPPPKSAPVKASNPDVPSDGAETDPEDRLFQPPPLAVAAFSPTRTPSWGRSPGRSARASASPEPSAFPRALSPPPPPIFGQASEPHSPSEPPAGYSPTMSSGPALISEDFEVDIGLIDAQRILAALQESGALANLSAVQNPLGLPPVTHGKGSKKTSRALEVADKKTPRASRGAGVTPINEHSPGLGGAAIPTNTNLSDSPNIRPPTEKVKAMGAALESPLAAGDMTAVSRTPRRSRSATPTLTEAPFLVPSFALPPPSTFLEIQPALPNPAPTSTKPRPSKNSSPQPRGRSPSPPSSKHNSPDPNPEDDYSVWSTSLAARKWSKERRTQAPRSVSREPPLAANKETSVTQSPPSSERVAVVQAPAAAIEPAAAAAGNSKITVPAVAIKLAVAAAGNNKIPIIGAAAAAAGGASEPKPIDIPVVLYRGFAASRGVSPVKSSPPTTGFGHNYGIQPTIKFKTDTKETAYTPVALKSEPAPMEASLAQSTAAALHVPPPLSPTKGPGPSSDVAPRPRSSPRPGLKITKKPTSRPASPPTKSSLRRSPSPTCNVAASAAVVFGGKEPEFSAAARPRIVQGRSRSVSVATQTLESRASRTPSPTGAAATKPRSIFAGLRSVMQGSIGKGASVLKTVAKHTLLAAPKIAIAGGTTGVKLALKAGSVVLWVPRTLLDTTGSNTAAADLLCAALCVSVLMIAGNARPGPNKAGPGLSRGGGKGRRRY